MAETGSAKPRRWLRVALAVSLVLNLALVGLIAGAALRVKSGGPPRGFDLSLGPVGAALSREDRRAIARELRNSAAPMPRRDRTEAVVRDLQRVLRADPFAPEALAAALDGPRVELQGFRDAAQTALIARIAEMTPGERSALADRLAEQLRRR